MKLQSFDKIIFAEEIIKDRSCISVIPRPWESRSILQVAITQNINVSRARHLVYFSDELE
jgi:hypothetical protein